MLKLKNLPHWIFLITIALYVEIFLIPTRLPEIEITRSFFEKLISISSVAWILAAFFTWVFNRIHWVTNWLTEKNYIKGLDERWKFVGATIEGNDFFIDTETFKLEVHAQCWYMIVSKTRDEFRFFRPKKTLVSKILREVDCTTKTSRNLRVIALGYDLKTLYDSNDSPTFEPSAKWESSTPGSMAEALVKEICEMQSTRNDNLSINNVDS